jgi:N,N'-diacetylchitobiose transport system permease protein
MATTTADVPRAGAGRFDTVDTERALARKSVFQRRRRYRTWGWNTVAIVLCVVFAFPIYWMLLTAFGNRVTTASPSVIPTHLNVTFFHEVLTGDNGVFVKDLRNTAIITVGAVLISVIVGFLGALAIARFRFAGRKIFVFVIMSIQMIPLVALTIPIDLILGDENLKNNVGLILSYLVFTTPYMVWTLRTFIANVPRELDEAAMVDGCNRWQVFTRIILPLAGPGLLATGVYAWIQAWNEFVMANLVLTGSGKQTLMVYLQGFLGTQNRAADFGGLMAASTLSSLPVVILFMIFQGRVAAGLTAGAVKG